MAFLPDFHVLAAQAAMAVVIPKAINQVKESNAAWTQYWQSHTDIRNAVTSFLAAFAAVGFAASFDGTLEAGGKLTIIIPALDNWVRGGVLWALQFCMQEASYRLLWKKNASKFKPSVPPLSSRDYEQED